MKVDTSKTATITFTDKEAREIVEFIDAYVVRYGWNPSSVNELTKALKEIA